LSSASWTMAGRRDCDRSSIPMTVLLAGYIIHVSLFTYLGSLAQVLK
jgi:hypothetical protein